MIIDYGMSLVRSIFGNGLLLLLLEIQTCYVLVEVGLGNEYRKVFIGLGEFEGADNRMSAAGQIVANFKVAVLLADKSFNVLKLRKMLGFLWHFKWGSLLCKPNTIRFSDKIRKTQFRDRQRRIFKE